MPDGQAKRSVLLLVLWGLIAVVLIGGVVSSFLALIYWDSFIALSNKWGNVVSVAGVWLGFIAFLVTILSLGITHRAEKEARDKIRQTLANASDAVTKAQEETRTALAEASRIAAAGQAQTREAIARIGFGLLQSECTALVHTVREIQRLAGEAATRGEYWGRAAERCRETAHAANLLLAIPHLTEEETTGLRRGADDLTDIARFIERNRVPAGSSPNPLRGGQAESLEKLLTLIINIETRMRRRMLEIPNANS